MALTDQETERALKMALAHNARLERENVELRLKREPAPPVPLSDEVMKKLELNLDKDDREMVRRVLSGVEVCLESSREKLIKSRQTNQARDCEHRRQEVTLLLKKLV